MIIPIVPRFAAEFTIHCQYWFTLSKRESNPALPSLTRTASRISLEGRQQALTLESIPSSVQPLPTKPNPLSLLTRNGSPAIGMFLASIPLPCPSPSTNNAILNPLPCISWWSRSTKRSRRCGRNDSNAPVGSGEDSWTTS